MFFNDNRMSNFWSCRKKATQKQQKFELSVTDQVELSNTDLKFKIEESEKHQENFLINDSAAQAQSW